MTFSIVEVTFIAAIYMTALFLVAYASDRGIFPASWNNHPIIYTLSTGVVISAWAYYGVVDLAFQYGYGAIAYYLGAGALFFFAPVALLPLVQLARRFRIRSLADLMVFRYHNQLAGAVTTLCIILASLPILALQIQVVADTVQIITANTQVHVAGIELPFRDVAALGYCSLLIVFTVIYGTNTDDEKGLVTALALDALVKVAALGAIGLLAIYGVFGSPGGLDQWLIANPEQFELLHKPARESSSHTLLLVFLASAVTLPHLFHMASVKAKPEEVAATLSWGFPLLLLLMALPIFPILWAGFELAVPLPAQYFTLGVPLFSESRALTILAFVGGISATTGALVVVTLHLGTMIMNHWVLPFTTLRQDKLHHQINRIHSILIGILFAVAYSFYLLMNNNFSLTDMALMYFIGTLQFLPGTFSVAFWPNANSKGFMSGLGVGAAIWLMGVMLPSITGISGVTLPLLELEIPLGIDYWQYITLLSLTLNLILILTVSAFTRTSEEERYSAELCTDDELSHPLRKVLNVHSVEDFTQQLAQSLGERDAQREIDHALNDLGLNHNERRPYALRRLRNQLEINLSGLMGTTVASELVNKHIPYGLPEGTGSTDINLIESRLSEYRNQLTGMAAELDNLRLFHRNTLEELPLAICSLGRGNEIIMWNRAMEHLTGIHSDAIIGSDLNSLEQPWKRLILDFAKSPTFHEHNRQIAIQGKLHRFSLHKANIKTPMAHSDDSQVILLEDTTELQRLEKELIHSERLASIGRLAAGVAHEIGNPVTGIACLAQNLKYDTDSEDVHETAEQIVGQTGRISSIVQSLVTFAHSGTNNDSHFGRVQVSECASEAIQLLALNKDKTQVRYENRIDPLHTIMGDSQRLAQVFINLLSNARDASPENSAVELDSHIDNNTLIVEVTDAGDGISKAHQAQVFEPFFTSKEPGEGTGLGLAMVYSIMEQHNAQIEIESPPAGRSRGTKFILKFPLISAHRLESNT